MQLIELLPDWYDENQTMQELQKILSEETDQLEKGLDGLTKECFPALSSSQLTRYEKIFGIQSDVTKPDGFRQEQLVAKITGAGTTTKSMIEDVSRAYSNGDVLVVEDNANSRFTVRFVGTLGIPANLPGLKQTIEEIKPAHLAVDYEYLYNTWENMEAATWGSVETYTWEGVRTVKL